MSKIFLRHTFTKNQSGAIKSLYLTGSSV